MVKVRHYEDKCNKCGVINNLSVLFGGNSIKKSKACQLLESIENYEKSLRGELSSAKPKKSRQKKEK